MNADPSSRNPGAAAVLPQLNGNAERSHRTDKDEFYQLLTYRDEVDLVKKLAAWERFHVYCRPHGARKGKDALRSSAGEAKLIHNARLDA